MPRLNEETGLKECSKCHEHKPAEMFSGQKLNSDKLSNQCKMCKAEYKRNLNFKPSAITELTCIRCLKLLPIDSFYKNKRNSNGYASHCKECGIVENKKYKRTPPKITIEIDEKKCSKCNLFLKISEFYKYIYSKDGYKSECKNCSSIDAKNKNYTITTEKSTKQCSKCFVEKSIDNFHPRKAAKDGLCSSCKQCEIEYRKLKYTEKQTKDKCNSYRRKKMKTDVVFNIAMRVRGNLRAALVNKCNRKSKKSVDILGLSYIKFKDYLYDNSDVEIIDVSKYDLDHIIPVSLAITEQDVYLLNHYTNLRLLPRAENITKGNKIYLDVIENHFKDYPDSPAYNFYLNHIKRTENE